MGGCWIATIGLVATPSKEEDSHADDSSEEENCQAEEEVKEEVILGFSLRAR